MIGKRVGPPTRMTQSMSEAVMRADWSASSQTLKVRCTKSITIWLNSARDKVVEKSSDPDDALVEEFTRLLQELQVGQTRRQALLDFADRAPLESVSEFVSAIVQAEERGNPVAEVLQIQAGVSRMRRSVKAEEAAAKAGVQMVGPLFLLFFCIMLLVMGPMILQLASQAD